MQDTVCVNERWTNVLAYTCHTDVYAVEICLNWTCFACKPLKMTFKKIFEDGNPKTLFPPQVATMAIFK
jgi:hypothetical protein